LPAMVAPVMNWNLAACSHHCLHHSAPAIGHVLGKPVNIPCKQMATSTWAKSHYHETIFIN
jgi:hypothetical protein